MKDFIKELRWRNMLQEMVPGTGEFLNKGMASGYIGFDPSADSLGIGNLVQVMTLVHFQRCGHKPFALVGGATGMVGDPSGKSQERNLLSKDVLMHNLSCQQKQLEKFLDFTCGDNAAQIVNNYDWFKDFGFLDFIREVGKNITVNYMLAKDSVKNRLENGMSFTEFSYQLIQGYDFYYLYKHHGIKIQMGGSDQWGNITTGTELIRKMDGGEAFALTTPLMKKADGTKFGKTESGNIWLDPARTSPYKLYQFWINASDEDIPNFFRVFTLREQEDVLALETEHKAAPHLRLMQKELAAELTTRVHGARDYEMALAASDMLFGKGNADALLALDESYFLEVFEGVPQTHIPHSELHVGIPIIELLADKTGIFPSRGEARKMLQQGGVMLNREKIDETLTVDSRTLIRHRYLLLQKGKKNYYLVIAGE
jgi:tyrosyl-tRNA synthetase